MKFRSEKAQTFVLIEKPAQFGRDCADKFDYST
jgi:hypothetical protein